MQALSMLQPEAQRNTKLSQFKTKRDEVKSRGEAGAQMQREQGVGTPTWCLPDQVTME